MSGRRPNRAEKGGDKEANGGLVIAMAELTKKRRTDVRASENKTSMFVKETQGPSFDTLFFYL